jgi:ribosomal protein L14
MLLKESWVYISDNTNVCWVKTFHLYKGFSRKVTKPGLFIKASARIVEPPRLEYKGFKYKYSVKGDITRAWIVRSVFVMKNKDKSTISFSHNTSIIINKKSNLKSKFLNGPLPSVVRVKKLNTLFSPIL